MLKQTGYIISRYDDIHEVGDIVYIPRRLLDSEHSGGGASQYLPRAWLQQAVLVRPPHRYPRQQLAGSAETVAGGLMSRYSTTSQLIQFGAHSSWKTLL